MSGIFRNSVFRWSSRCSVVQKARLWTGRCLIVAFLVGGAIVSFQVRESFGSVFEAFQTFLSFFQGALLALLLLGMMSRRVTQWGGLFGLLLGVTVAVVLYLCNVLFLWTAWWSFVAALIGTIVVSLCTKPYESERLRGLVCWLPAEKEVL